MKKICGLFLLAFLVACIFLLCACGAGDTNGTPEVPIPEGYTTYNDGYISFAYPADWSKTDGDVVVLKKLGGAGNNITVVYENKTDMYEKLTLAGFNAQLKPAYEAAGMAISDAKVEHKTVRGEKIAIISYSAVMNGQALKQTAYAITSGARTYSITVTEIVPDAELAENVFETIKVVKPNMNNTSASTGATTAEPAPGTCQKHDYGDWKEAKAPTCGEEGEKSCVCGECGSVLTVPIPKLTEHSFTDAGKCSVCGAKMDENFVFTLNEDKKSYSFGYKGFAEGTVRVPREYNGLPVTKISDAAFFVNYDLVNVKLPDTIVEIGEEAFKGCSKLRDFYIPDSVEVIGAGAFVYCEMLTTIKIPEGVTRIEARTFSYSGVKMVVLPKSLTYIGKEAFSGCMDIKSISIPANVEEIDAYAFFDAGALSNVSFESGSKLKIIADYAFADCSSLAGFVVPNGTEEIGKKAFAFCLALERIEIPATVKVIGDEALAYTEKLEKIIFGGTEEEWNKISLGEKWDDRSSKYKIIFNN